MTRPSTIDVELTPAEGRILTWVGRQRFENARALERNFGLNPGKVGGGADYDIRGAHGEYAMSVGVNLFWRPTIGSIADKDVGGILQARCIANPKYDLRIKPKDLDDDPFVLVLQLSPLKYRLLGWMFAGEVKRNYPLRTDRGDPMHCAPQGDLHDMPSLMDWIARARVAELAP